VPRFGLFHQRRSISILTDQSGKCHDAYRNARRSDAHADVRQHCPREHSPAVFSRHPLGNALTRSETAMDQACAVPFVDRSENWTKPEELGALRLWARKAKVAVEVGTWTGRSAVQIASVLADGGTLYCVDNFCGDPEERIRDNHFGQFDPEEVVSEWRKRIEPYGERVVLIRAKSINAAASFKAAIDFLFIDGCHHYEAVMADLRAWVPLVRDGGTVCGHDYWPENKSVMHAVDEFFRGRNVTIGPGCLWRMG
jgi:predicted O-methyltransferase YrrM